MEFSLASLPAPDYLTKLARFRTLNEEDATVLNYFDELEVHPEHFGRAGWSVLPLGTEFVTCASTKSPSSFSRYH